MSEPTPLLSIVMPTRDRMDCARHTVENISKFEESDFELIIQDNSKDDDLLDWFDRRPFDIRLRYNRLRRRTSMSRNFELAIEQARGLFLCCLGDDDGLNPCVIQLTRWLEENNLDALSPTYCAHYFWPGVDGYPEGNGAGGRLTLVPFSGRMKLCDPEEEVLKCVKGGGIAFYNLPRFYHGVVRRSCMEAVRKKTGRYLPGISPDMAAAVSLASVVNSVAQIDYPVFVPGASAKSGAGRGIQRTHLGALSNEGFLDEEFLNDWPKEVPAFFSGSTMRGAAVVHALKAIGRTDVLEKMNLASLHAACVVYDPNQASETFANFRDLARSQSTSHLKTWSQFSIAYVTHWLRRLRQLLLRVTVTTYTNESVHLSNIDNAMVFLQEELASKAAPLLESLPTFGVRDESEQLRTGVGLPVIRRGVSARKSTSA